MKITLLVLIILSGVFAFGNSLNTEVITEDSEIRILHSAHIGTNVILKNIDGKELPLKQIEYRAICKKGTVKTETHYFTINSKVIKKEEQCKTDEYIQLWNDLINIGLEELSALPLDLAIDPFEFIDSWRIDQDTHSFHFKAGNRTIDFTLYDIESFRDVRFRKILKRSQKFFSHQCAHLEKEKESNRSKNED